MALCETAKMGYPNWCPQANDYQMQLLISLVLHSSLKIMTNVHHHFQCKFSGHDAERHPSSSLCSTQEQPWCREASFFITLQHAGAAMMSFTVKILKVNQCVCEIPTCNCGIGSDRGPVLNRVNIPDWRGRGTETEQMQRSQQARCYNILLWATLSKKLLSYKVHVLDLTKIKLYTDIFSAVRWTVTCLFSEVVHK